MCLTKELDGVFASKKAAAKDRVDFCKVAHLLRDEESISKGNRLILIKRNGEKEEIKSFKNLKITYKGSCSLIEIHESVRIKKEASFICENRSYIRLNQDVVLAGAKINAADDATFFCDNNGDLKNIMVYLNTYPGLEVIIGKDCLCSTNIIIRTNDAHTMFLQEDPSHILNEVSVGVHIGDHVWIGQNVFFTKDSCIPNGCIIGACSVVTRRQFTENSILVGNPAKVIKTGIDWSRSNIVRYKEELALSKRNI